MRVPRPRKQHSENYTLQNTIEMLSHHPLYAALNYEASEIGESYAARGCEASEILRCVCSQKEMKLLRKYLYEANEA